MANMTSAPSMTTMHGYMNTTDDNLSTETTEFETQIPFENYTGNSTNSSESEYPYYDGEWIGILHPMVWKIPHFENLFVYGLGTCLVLGTFGNIFSFIILLRKNMRKMPTTPYLCSLAVVDLILLWAITQEEWFLKVTGRPVIDKIPCDFSFYFIYAAGLWSSWLLVFLTAERFLVIKFPFKTLTRANSSRARYILIVMLPIFCFSLTSFYLFIFEDTPYGCDYIEGLNPKVSEGLEVSFLMLSNIAPLSILLICNGLIAFELSKSSMKLESDQNIARQREIRKLTILALVVSVTYIILTSPVSIFYTVLTLMGQPFVSPDNGEVFAVSTENMFLIQMIVEVLNYSNHCINFLLYMVASPRFREEVLRLIPKRLKREAHSNSSFKSSKNLTSETNLQNSIQVVAKDITSKGPNCEGP